MCVGALYSSILYTALYCSRVCMCDCVLCTVDLWKHSVCRINQNGRVGSRNVCAIRECLPTMHTHNGLAVMTFDNQVR